MTAQHLASSARGAAQGLAKLISPKTGQLKSQTDIGAYGKLASALQINGFGREANLSLNYVWENFVEENGDYKHQMI